MSNRSNGWIKNDPADNHHGKRYIMLNCFVLGNGASFTFDIKDEKNSDVVTFSHFREKLVQNKRKIFREAEAEDLKLWRVNIHTRRNKEYEELKENPHLDIDIGKKFGGEVLDASWSIIKEFSNPPEEHVHIIVQPPSPPATTEHIRKKRRLWIKDPRKRSVIQGSSNEVRQVPISQSEFTLVRENHLLYVDKTYWLSKLNLNCGYYFVSRPRKFGKSMFLSMIESFFLVQCDLFEGLYVYENPPKINVESAEKIWDKDLPPIPVIRLDFSKLTSNEGPEVLKKELIRSLKSIGKYNITLEYDTVKSVTEELITALADHQENVYRKVVILIDEYDFPILSVFNATKESLEIADKNHEILKGFFEVIKALQTKVKFLLVTGVTMFAQLGLFSGANNLDDVTISSVLSGAYGFTDKEIKRTFGSLLTRSRYSMEDLQKKYNGYSWDCDVKVYNPYSICMFFNKLELENHWIQKGKTSFLAKLIDTKHIKKIVGEITIKKKLIVPVNIEAIQNSFDPPVPLLFQTGYLTIKQQKVDDDNDICFILEIPNTEVKESLMSELWANLDKISIGTACDRIQRLAKLLKEDKFIEFMIKFNYDLASIPYNESQYAGKYEGFYHSHVHMLVRYIGLPFRSEDATSRGRTDMCITTRTAVYYIEYKRYTRKTIDDQIIENLIQEAIKQIFTTEYYAGNTELHTKTQYAIGCIFSTETRKICGVGIQEFDLESGIVNKKQLKKFINEFSPADE